MSARLSKLFRTSLKSAQLELARMDLESVAKVGISKSHVDLLGSHTVVTYPPLDALVPVEGNLLRNELRFRSEVDAYVHIPFCEYPCTFCPYTTLGINGKDAELLPEYSDALKIEIKGWADQLNKQGAKVRSVYVGGGTPFAVPIASLEEI